MPKLRDQMSEALTSAAVAAREQGEASALDGNGAAPRPADAEPAEVVPAALALLDRPKPQQAGDLVQFGFRCPRDLKRQVERFCFEREVTLQEFGQAALRLLLDELAKQETRQN